MSSFLIDFDGSNNNFKSQCTSSMNISEFEVGAHGSAINGKPISYACGDPVGSSPITPNTSSTPSDQVDKVNSSPSLLELVRVCLYCWVWLFSSSNTNMA